MSSDASMSKPRAEAAAPPLGQARWQVRLLGAVEAFDGQQRIERFPSRAVAALLARVASAPERAHSREELVELLWPGVELPVGRNRLRQALSTLKSLLEPPGVPGAAVLQADRLSVRAVRGALGCDALDFERLARGGRAAEARALYGGEFMPGFYDEWIDDERQRLAALRDHLGTPGPQAPAVAAVGPSARPAPAAATAHGWSEMRSQARLPSYLTRLFGAEHQAARLRSQVLSHRLVTLLGPGGAGKTRLTVDVAQALQEQPPWSPRHDDREQAFERVAFVSLVSCNSAAQLVDAVAAVLPAAVAASPPLQRLLDALAGSRTLLVLDNFEQLVDAAAGTVAELLARLPLLHVLVTSRRLLGLDGEREFALAPLALPAPETPLAEAAANPAVALFVDRARAARADFHLGERQCAPIVALVRALQGMPLAIELAASRVRSFAPAEMLTLLQRPAVAGETPGLDLLARSGPRTGLDPRHASMQRAIEWSWGLISPELQALMGALTVFHGGCSAAAAASVFAGHHPDPATHLLLDEAVSHSLLQAMPGDDGELRFSPYEPVREYAGARLTVAQAAHWRAAHRAWMQRWATELPVTPPLAQARAEMDNLCAALASAVRDGVPDQAVRLLLQLRRLLEDVELPTVGLTHAQAAVQQCADATQQSRGHSLLGPLLLQAGRHAEGQAQALAGLESLPADQPALRARALHSLARVRWRSRREATETLPLLDEAQHLAEAADDVEVQAGVMALRAFVSNVHARDHVRARALHAGALALWQQLGNQHAVHGGLYNLATTDHHAGRHAQALASLTQLIEAARALQDWRRLSQASNVAALSHAALLAWPQAQAALCEAVRISWQHNAAHDLIYPLWNLPPVLAHRRQPVAALQLAAFVAAYWRHRAGPLSRSDERDGLRVRRLAARLLDAQACAAAWAEGERLTLAQAVHLALQA